MTRAMRTAALAALVLGAGAPARLAAQAPDPNAILDRAVATYGHVQTIRADFTQLVEDPMLADTQTSRGELFEQRPGKFALRWSDPRGDLIVADGQYLWVYLPSSAPHQVARSALGVPGSQGADIIAEFLDHPHDRLAVAYDRADAVDGRPADVLVLTPHDHNAQYRHVRIWVDRADALVRRIEMTDGAGTVRRFTLDHLRTNAAIPASVFSFTPPPGTRVVDATESNE